MENGQEAKPVEDGDAVQNEVKKDEPADKTESEISTEKSEEPTTELLEKIKNQVEFYFGDVNMQRDKFLIEQTKLDEGWIPMSIMLNFKMLAAMSKDSDVILKALESSELIEISEDRKKIRRSPSHPLPVYDEAYRKAQEAKTVYLKGFPKTDMNIAKLKAFFADFEPCENILMRKYQDNEKKLQFKGSIFVQFNTLEDAQKFMARESVKYGDTELIRKWSADYAAEKAKEREEHKQKKMKKQVQETQIEQEEDKGLPKGSIFHISEVPTDISREDIKKRLGELDATVAFIDYKKGQTEGYVRLQGENAAKPLFEKMNESKLSINENEITCRILEGEEEEKYLAKTKEEMQNIRQRSQNLKRGGRKGRGGQRGGKRKSNNDSRDTTPAKKATLE